MSAVVDLLGRVGAAREATARVRAARAEVDAPDFSPFQFIGRQELGLSRVLAWLLRPTGSHGQRARFLQLFVAKFGLAWNATRCAGATARLEVETTHSDRDGRIDVLVEADGHAFAIENKIWASDLNGQVEGYLTHLRSLHGDGRYKLFYLSPHGRDPSEASIRPARLAEAQASGALKLVGYDELLPWLDECRAACLAARVSTFIQELQLHLRKTVMKEPDATELKAVTAEMMSSEDSISAALAVARSAEAMKLALWKKLIADVSNAAAKVGWTCEGRLWRTGRVQWSGLSVRYGSKDDIAFDVQFQDDRRSEVICGIRARGLGPGRACEIYAALFNRFKGGGQEEVWPWKHGLPLPNVLPVTGDWYGSDTPWIMIKKGTLTPLILAAAEQLHAALLKGGFVPPRQPTSGAGAAS